MNRKQVRSPGIALIMALSVIMLLSVALMKSFENRTIETLHLENSLQRFQAETLSRSVLRAILVGLKRYGLLALFKNQQRWKGFPVPLNETQYFQIEAIESMDHRFNLNRRYRIEDDNPWPTVFHNIINSFPDVEYETFETIQLYSALNDWTDQNKEQDIESNDNYEEYQEANPQFEVKNRHFDRLSELKLIPSFHDTKFTPTLFEKWFRIYPIDEKDSEKIAIDLNLATLDDSGDSSSDIRQFLSMFKDVDKKYPKIYENIDDIVKILSDRDEELASDEEAEANFLKPTPRFEDPDAWKKALDDYNLKQTLTANEIELFSTQTHLLAIRFSLTVTNTTVFTKAVVRVNYTNPKKLDIAGFEILELTMK